jgi:hypothetical protein
MNETQVKPTANQLYKQSNSSLPFKEWIEREKTKGVYIKNALLDEVKISPSTKKEDSESLTSKFDLGIPKWVMISGIIVIISAFAYNKMKK